MNLQKAPMKDGSSLAREEDKKLRTGIRLAATSATSAAATNSRPVVEFTRNNPATSTAVARILALGSRSCTGEATG